jgi:DedD protein
MDHELKQRLIGAVVVTALAAIFIPMLFDDPVDNSGKAVTELTIPQAPANSSSTVDENLPENKAQILNRPDMELSVSEEEDGHANSTGEGQATKKPDGQQVEQPGTTESLTDAGSDNQESKPVDEAASKQPGHNEEPSLDTGVVDEVKQPEVSQDNTTVKTFEASKKLEQNSEISVKKQMDMEAAPDELKVKPVTSIQKPKTVVKSKKAIVQKSSSKLVRYSIQVGSFSKKENAQALVDKLRKQGMPASIVTKGDLYRVKIGPELDKKKAAAMKAKLDSQNIKGLLTSE